MVSAWPEPPFASIADVCDGLEALALGGTITEARPNRAGEEHGGIQAVIFNLPGTRLIGSIPNRSRLGWSPHLFISFAQKVVEIFDVNQAEPWIFHVRDGVKRDCQGTCENYHVNPATCRGRGHAKAGKQRPT